MTPRFGTKASGRKKQTFTEIGKLWVEKVWGGGNQEFGWAHNKFEMPISQPSGAVQQAIRIYTWSSGEGSGLQIYIWESSVYLKPQEDVEN